MIEFQNVSRSYGNRLAVDSLTLTIPQGELYTLLGHNGAGKTTALKMLVGLLQPDSGKITIDGHDLVTHVRDATRLIGYVPDQPFLYDKLSGREFLQFVVSMYGIESKQAEERLQAEIDRFQLAPFLDNLTESYSHGMKQRTVFAAALVHSPRVLVIDEPMVGLDPHSMRLVKDLLREEVSRGMCVLMSTHTLTAAEEIADRIGIMSAGKLVFSGTVDELHTQTKGSHASLESLYLSLTVDE